MSTGSGFSGGASEAGDEPPETGAVPAARREDDGTFADILNGFSLDSGRGRRKRRKRSDFKKGADFQEDATARAAGSSSPADQGDHVNSVVSPLAGTDGVSPAAGGLFDPDDPGTGYAPLGAYPSFGEPTFTDQPYNEQPYSGSSFAGHRISAGQRLGEDSFDRGEDTAIVRPYALTGGRTKSNYALELETLVSTKVTAEGAISEAVVEQVESLSIMEECRNPRSVAEIAAILRVPLGVARVLISDAADAGLVTVHKTISGNDGAEAHLVLMERVLSGLRRL
jgi:hypothetical protein